MKQLILALVFGSLAACVTAPMPFEEHFDLKPGTDWVANSPEWAEDAEAVFADAVIYIEQVATRRAPGTWAVVLDADETIINNVQYQIERDKLGVGFSQESWTEWTAREEATLVPGAKEFIEAVYANGGLVAIVTNRSDREQLATENNLAALGLERGEDFHVLLTLASKRAEARDTLKDARYGLVPVLLDEQGYPGVEVVAYLGDNVKDQPKTLPEGARFFCIDQGGMYSTFCANPSGSGVKRD